MKPEIAGKCETIVGYNFTQQNGPTETVERLNRAYPLTDSAESRMR